MAAIIQIYARGCPLLRVSFQAGAHWPPMPWSLEDPYVITHFHSLLLLAPCHQWPDHCQPHGTIPVLQGRPEDSNEVRDGLSLGFPLELLSGADPEQGHLLETSTTEHTAQWCGGAPQQPPRHGCRQWCSAPGDHLHPPNRPRCCLRGTESHTHWRSWSSGERYWGPVEVAVLRYSGAGVPVEQCPLRAAVGGCGLGCRCHRINLCWQSWTQKKINRIWISLILSIQWKQDQKLPWLPQSYPKC